MPHCTHTEFLFPFRSNRSLYNVDRDRLATLANQSMRRVISAEVTQGDSCPGISPPQCRISPFHFLPCFLWGLICRVSSRGRSQKVRCLARVQGGRSASRPRTLSWQSRAASRNQTKPNQMVPYYKLRLPCTLNLAVVIDDFVVILSLFLSHFCCDS